MAGEIYPKFPGKGADKGWYQTDEGYRYYAGGNDFRYSDPQGRTNLGAMLGGIFSPKPLSAEKQALSDKKTAWLNSGRKGPNPYLTSSSPAVTTPSSNNSNNASEINARLKQQAAEKEAALKRTKGNYDHSSGSYTGQDVAFVPDSTLNTGGGGGNRDNSRVIPGSGGKVQKGTNMSRSFNQLLKATNTSGYQPFSSNQLPTTAGSPDSNIGPVTDGVVYADMLQNAPGAGTKGIGPLADGEAYARAVGGNGKSTSRLDAALSDTAGINSYMSKFSSGDQERAANRAFLDTEDSMLALRAKEAVNRVVYAGGQHYISGKSGDDQAIGINRGQARDISNGKSSAQSLLQEHIAKTKNAATPAEAQEPPTIEKPGVKQSFGRSETISSPIDTSIPDTTAFNVNNGVDVASFENKGGYKPMSKKPEVDYSKIFSY